MIVVGWISLSHECHWSRLLCVSRAISESMLSCGTGCERAEPTWYYGCRVSTQAASHLGRTLCRSTDSTGISFIKVKGCLDVRSCLEELSYTSIEPGSRVLMQTVSILKFRISETLCSILVRFPTPTIQFPGHTATTNHFLALSAHCPCLSACSESSRVK